MARLFVFGIGGSGARVLKSLTILLASGVKVNGYTIVPILIDPHQSMPEFNSCKELMKTYSNINERLYDNITNDDDGFFRAPIKTLASIAPGSGIKDDFGLDGNYSITFGQFIGKNNLPRESKTLDFLSLLYSDDENFNKSLSVGFKGNPNVGSIVLNEMSDSQVFKTFETAFGVNDKIFIISSIFGGTGAAGFPLLLKNLRQHKNLMIRNASIGALTLMPYFKLTNPDGGNNSNSDIDSKNFVAKTKAALTYYINNITNLNAFYYLADPYEQTKAYENNEALQHNGAHLLELLGALGIIHFSNSSFTGSMEIFEYGLDNNSPLIHFKNMGSEARQMLDIQLSSFQIFTILHESIKKRDNLPFRRSSGFDDKFFNDPFFDTLLEKFIKEYYNKWLTELENNERSFSPFSVKDKEAFHDLIKESSVKKSTFEGLFKESFDVYDVFVNMAKNENRFFENNKINKIYQYIQMSRDGILKTLKANIQFK